MAFKVNLNRVHRLPSYPFLLISNVPSPGSQCFAKNLVGKEIFKKTNKIKKREKGTKKSLVICYAVLIKATVQFYLLVIRNKKR